MFPAAFDYFVLYKLNVLRYIALSADELINQFGQFRNPELTLTVISTICISPDLQGELGSMVWSQMFELQGGWFELVSRRLIEFVF